MNVPDEILSELSAERIKRHVEHIVREIPSRLAGSENGRRMAQYSCSQIEKAGLDARIERVSALVSFPRAAELRIIAPEEMVLPANTFGHSVLTSPEGITGELVYVKDGHFGDYDGKDVQGRVTLSELSYSPGRHEKQRIAGLMGSTAQIMRNWGPDDSEAVPFGSVKPAWGIPTPETAKTEMPTIPCIGISRLAGKYLLDLLEKGPVKVNLKTDVDNGWRDIHLTVGEMPVDSSDDFVLVGGHQDSWYGEASTDNAAGNACMMELARVFNKHRAKLRRGLVFGFWSAHETGTMSGSAWFADRYWDRLRKNAVAYLMIDQPAMLGTSRWAVHSNIELRRFHEGIERSLLRGTVQEWHLAQKVGDTSFFGIGLPSFWAEGGFTPEELQASALATNGWWHHSLECTIDKLDWAWMEDHIRIYAGYLWALCTSPVLPYEFISVADQFIRRLGDLLPSAAGLGIEGTVSRAESFRRKAEELDSVAKYWNGKAVKAEAGTEPAVKAINECLKKLSRILIPVASTEKGTYGHDTYSYTPQSTVIPALYDVTQFGAIKENGPEKWQLATKLMRQRNRVTDALIEADELVSKTLADVRRYA